MTRRYGPCLVLSGHGNAWQVGARSGKSRQGAAGKPRKGAACKSRQSAAGKPRQGAVGRPRQGFTEKPWQGAAGRPWQGFTDKPWQGATDKPWKTSLTNPGMPCPAPASRVKDWQALARRGMAACRPGRRRYSISLARVSSSASSHPVHRRGYEGNLALFPRRPPSADGAAAPCLSSRPAMPPRRSPRRPAGPPQCPAARPRPPAPGLGARVFEGSPRASPRMTRRRRSWLPQKIRRPSVSMVAGYHRRGPGQRSA
jgi:hypothetical protein